LIDKIDELIISALSQNSKQEVFEIWDFLKGFNYSLTEEEIESRISQLEEGGIIKGYTITVDG
jgi:Lrp/AsnC family leucine-responsive transcriptional regulator